MITGPTAFFTIAEAVLDAVRVDLTSSEGGSVNRVCVVPGQIAWDECDCGMLAASPGRWFLTDNFPTSSGNEPRTTPCDFPYVVCEITFLLVRCAPQPGEASTSVPCPPLSAAARILTSDAAILLGTVSRKLCEMKDDDEIIDYLLADQLAVGPGGACVGVELRAMIEIPR